MNVKKMMLVVGCLAAATSNAYAAGLDMTFFGYKVGDVSFDANPFSRDDGRPKGMVVSSAPTYYTPPPATYIGRRTVAYDTPSVSAKSDEKSIVIKDSSNVTILTNEEKRHSSSMYAPSTTYPTYYSTPTYVTPTYYYGGGYYPGYYRPYGYGWGGYYGAWGYRPYRCW